MNEASNFASLLLFPKQKLQMEKYVKKSKNSKPQQKCSDSWNLQT